MNIINKLEKQFGRYIPENLTLYLIFGQIAAYFLTALYPELMSVFILRGDMILAGQVWRMFTYLFKPVSDSLFFAAFVLYIFYLYGSVLERTWGSFKYFIYILISYAANTLLAFMFPQTSLSNGYLFTSLFFAFAWLFPNFQLLLFFILPVKIKWLALVAAAGISLSFLSGPLTTKILILTSLSNFFIFFGSDIVKLVQGRLGQQSSVHKTTRSKREPYHVCYVCKTNELKNTKMQIRYCDLCKPTTCYCADHIEGHPHRSR